MQMPGRWAYKLSILTYFFRRLQHQLQLCFFVSRTPGETEPAIIASLSCAVGIGSSSLFAGAGFPVNMNTGDGLLIRDFLDRKKKGRAKKSAPGATYKAAPPAPKASDKSRGFFQKYAHLHH